MILVSISYFYSVTLMLHVITRKFWMTFLIVNPLHRWPLSFLGSPKRLLRDWGPSSPVRYTWSLWEKPLGLRSVIPASGYAGVHDTENHPGSSHGVLHLSKSWHTSSGSSTRCSRIYICPLIFQQHYTRNRAHNIPTGERAKNKSSE